MEHRLATGVPRLFRWQPVPSLGVGVRHKGKEVDGMKPSAYRCFLGVVWRQTGWISFSQLRLHVGGNWRGSQGRRLMTSSGESGVRDGQRVPSHRTGSRKAKEAGGKVSFTTGDTRDGQPQAQSVTGFTQSL